MNEEPGRGILDQRTQTPQTNNNLSRFNIAQALRDAEDSTAESSSCTMRRERDGEVVPVCSPPASSYSKQFVGEENSFLQRHPQPHRVMNWTQRQGKQNFKYLSELKPISYVALVVTSFKYFNEVRDQSPSAEEWLDYSNSI
ncbi:hypothetical protein POM88_005290 [Heracleum sosnowskyi]|uniref:Uncharacterized protein n=1 Tax=Heracleum sosnowskyi TaxID=360622 RepID=A0AAD8JPR6_9APIA|nr:hypothetical protein POM88_005290 [Heracleum sosnowskyi]